MKRPRWPRRRMSDAEDRIRQLEGRVRQLEEQYDRLMGLLWARGVT